MSEAEKIIAVGFDNATWIISKTTGNGSLKAVSVETRAAIRSAATKLRAALREAEIEARKEAICGRG